MAIVSYPVIDGCYNLIVYPAYWR